MKTIYVGLFLLVLGISTCALEDDNGKRKRNVAEMTSKIKHHLRQRGGGDIHMAPAQVMRHAREDGLGLKLAQEPSAKKAERSEKIRRVAEQVFEQHRKSRHMGRPMSHFDVAQHSLADGGSKGLKPAPTSAMTDATNAKRKHTLGNLARQMSQGFNLDGAHKVTAKGHPGATATMRQAHASTRNSGHAAGPPKQLKESDLRNAHHKLARAVHQKFRRGTQGDTANPGNGGED